MSGFQIASPRNSTVWAIYRLKDRMDIDPVYQRDSDIWNLDKKQLLIDSILNRFDVPKIYLHKLPEPADVDGRTIEYTVIDGKQRLAAIWGFIEGQFPLADNFEYINVRENDEISAGGLTYADLARKYPDIKTDFDSYPLDIVYIETDDLELIEDMFSRLNEAVPLSAPEKRNARPGPLPGIVRELATHSFFTNNLPFSNRRYRHFDLIAKLLLIMASDSGVVDTKKWYLDDFFNRNARLSDVTAAGYAAQVSDILDHLHAVFVNDDPLLRQIGMTVLYFYIFKKAGDLNLVDSLNREDFVRFDTRRRENRETAATDIGRADYRLLEFDRFTQSPNDAYAMAIRLGVFDDMVFGGRLGFPQQSL
jgi:hypothetical protein